MKASKYTHRFLARVIIEAKTPLAIGSGEKDFETDSLVMRDVNGLPYIPGTSIAGVVRSMLDPEKKQLFYGFQRKDGGHGSEIIFTEGKILNSQGEVVDGLNSKAMEDDLLKHYVSMPIRQHACINERGTVKSHGKFDEQVVYAGTRFCFEIEVVSDGSNEQEFTKVLTALRNDSIRIGGGSCSGFGKFSVEEVKTASIDLRKDATLYLDKSSNFQKSAEWWEGVYVNKSVASIETDEYIKYTLTLRPDNFILFGSGLEDKDGNADMTTVKAKKVCWTNGVAEMKENLVLIPASSLKGAIRHRVAYHYNKRTHQYADKGVNLTDALEQNKAVRTLFGYEDGTKQVRGNVLFSDIIEKPASSKLFNHVAIDRFTGGALNGALFTEQVDYVAGEKYNTEILVRKSAIYDADIKYAFERTLQDICDGLLPLGGGVNRGHGMFTGSVEPKLEF